LTLETMALQRRNRSVTHQTRGFHYHCDKSKYFRPGKWRRNLHGGPKCVYNIFYINNIFYNIFAYCSICRVDCKFARGKKNYTCKLLLVSSPACNFVFVN
jgi:hypothetical protein